jgi:hypothetical protein
MLKIGASKQNIETEGSWHLEHAAIKLMFGEGKAEGFLLGLVDGSLLRFMIGWEDGFVEGLLLGLADAF